MSDVVDTGGEAVALATMLVSNPQGTLREDGDGWQKRVNDLIRALARERDQLALGLTMIREGAADPVQFAGKILERAGTDTEALAAARLEGAKEVEERLIAAIHREGGRADMQEEDIACLIDLIRSAPTGEEG